MDSKSKTTPPTHGQKLWRVKPTNGGAKKAMGSNFSMECFNNSKKISAAGLQYLTRRPPSRRPKNKPGMPKDFVFVDLSPVKSQESEMEGAHDLSSSTSSAPASNSGSMPPSPSSDDDSIFSALDSATLLSDLESVSYVQDTSSGSPLDAGRPEMGLGIMNLDFDMGWQSQPAAATQSAAELAHLQYPISNGQLPTPPQLDSSSFEFSTTFARHSLEPQLVVSMEPRGHKRANTVASIPTGVKAPALKRAKTTGDKRKSGEIQFKPYNAAAAGPRKPKAHRHTQSAPVVPQLPQKRESEPASNLEDFMLLNEQITVLLSDCESVDSGCEYSPITEYSSSDDFKSLSLLKNCAADQFLVQKHDEFDFNPFVTL